MKVVFLDFDGVVCALPRQKDTHSRSGKRVRSLNPECVAELNRLVVATDAVVVISSTWRLGKPLSHLVGYLRRAGYTGRVLDVTPDLRRVPPFVGLERGHEIQAWIHLRDREVESYVVLDDDLDLGSLPRDRWVHVREGWLSGGLQDHHVDAAIAALGRVL